MTCVVGAVDGDGQIYMGADSSAVDSNIITRHALSKVFKVDEFGIGYCHSFKLGQLVEFCFSPPPLEKKMDEPAMIRYMITEFIPELKGQLEAHGYPNHDDEKENWSLLVGIRGYLFTIESDFHLGYDETHYAAIGAGSEYALGAMFCSQSSGMKLARVGLEAAEYFCPYVIRPFNFIEV